MVEVFGLIISLVIMLFYTAVFLGGVLVAGGIIAGIGIGIMWLIGLTK